jgi:hypothetical protein
VLVFVGYSLYDIDIKRILASMSALKERTYFITRPGSSQEDLFTLGKFGYVIDCGVEEFANLLPDPNTIEYPSNTLVGLAKYAATHTEIDIKDNDIERLLLLGDYDHIAIENCIFSQKSSEYIILRDQLKQVEKLIKESNIIITSELGNGKTILMQELIPYMSISNNVYYVADYYANIIDDIKALSISNDKSIIVIDDYSKIIEIFDCYHLFSQDKIRFILSSRPSIHEKYRNTLRNMNFNFKEISVDEFSEKETIDLFQLIDIIGFWGIVKGKEHEKNKYFKFDCRSQLSVLLVHLLESPDIKNRIKNIFDDLVKNSCADMKKIIFTTAFLCIHNIRVDIALVSEIVGNTVYDSEIRSNALFREFFKFDQGKLITKSTLFCQSLIRNYFSPEYTIHALLNIAETFDKKKWSSKEHEAIFKSTLRFSTVERSLPNDNKKINLDKYYEALKRKVVWLVDDPHYWVQYAMAKVTAPDFSKAQQYLDNAYGKARAKYNYDTSNIDTQQARLFLLQAIQLDSTLQGFELFNKAHKLLRNTPNDIYKYRQLYLYVDYFNVKNNHLDETLRKKLFYAYEEMLHIIGKYGEDKEAHVNIDKLREIVASRSKWQ